MPVALYLLAAAVFAMGSSEFMLAGLLPDISTSLGVPVATGGLLTSAFAVGMVVGAPATAIAARRWPVRSTLTAFLLVFAAMHVVGALTGEFAVLLGTRIVAALVNAGFLAVALAAVRDLVPSDRLGRALAVLLAGTTVATVAGVPGGAVVGNAFGWRAAFWIVAVLSVACVAGVLRLPRRPSRVSHHHGLRGELGALRSPTLLAVMAFGALVNAATFGTFTYLAPMVTDAAGLGDGWVPATLAVFGVGSFVGVQVAGRWSDRRPGEMVAVAGPLLLAGWVALAVFGSHPTVLLPLAGVQGALSFAVGSTLIARVLYAAHEAPTMAGAYATAALNVGAVAGPVLAGLTLPAGDLAPAWASAGLVAVALTGVLLRRGVR